MSLEDAAGNDHDILEPLELPEPTK